MNKIRTKTPTKELFTIYEGFWSKHHTGLCMFGGADGKTAIKLWSMCKRERPDDPMGFFKERVAMIMDKHGMTPYLHNFRGLSSLWNMGAGEKTKSKGWIDQ